MAFLKDITTVATIGVIEYNSYQLVPARWYEFDMQPVYDDADRTVIARRYTLHGHFYILEANEDACSATMQTVRENLSESGKSLGISGIGFGDLRTGKTVAAEGSLIKELVYGPKPRVHRMQPVGGLIAWLVDWSVEFVINECASASVKDGDLMAFNFAMNIGIDGKGYTTATTAGYWQTVQTYPEGGTIKKTAMWQRDNFKCPVIAGMQRAGQTFNENAAKNRVDFTINDEELRGAAYPEGIVEADIDYQVSNEGVTFARWNAVISGTLETKAGNAKALAVQKFLAIASHYVARFKQGIGAEAVLIPQKFSFGTKLYNRVSRFSYGFTVAGCIHDVMAASGMWEAVPESNYTLWATSMAECWRPGGLANVKLRKDTIINLCGDAAMPTIQRTGNHTVDKEGPSQLAFSCDHINERTSWIAYQNHVRLVQKEQVAFQKLAQVRLPAVLSQFQHAGYITAAAIQEQAAKFSQANVPQDNTKEEDSVQYQGAPESLVVMYGKAMRIKFPPAIPALNQVLGAKPVLIDSEVEPAAIIGVVGTDNCVIYVARWAFLYRVPASFSTSDYMPGPENAAADYHCINPFLGAR